METPFIFGKIATEKNFTDREKETADLVQNFTSLINTIIISPRRWGKSSLVNKAARLAMAHDSNLRICHIDLFNVRSEEHLYSSSFYNIGRTKLQRIKTEFCWGTEWFHYIFVLY